MSESSEEDADTTAKPPPRGSCTTNRKSYPKEPWLCPCAKCSPTTTESIKKYRLRTRNGWEKFFRLKIPKKLFTTEVLEFLSIYFKSVRPLSRDLLDQARARFLALANSTDRPLPNIQYFTKTASVVAALVEFRNCTISAPLLRKSHYRDLVSHTRLDPLSTEFAAAYDDEFKCRTVRNYYSQYSRICEGATTRSFGTCLKILATHLDSSRDDIVSKFDVEVAGVTLQDALLQRLLARTPDRKDEFLLLLAQCFERHVGPYDEWTVHIWILALTEIDYDYSKHNAVCLFENDSLFRPEKNSRPLLRRGLMSRLPSHIFAVWALDREAVPYGLGYGEPSRGILPRLHKIPYIIFKECRRLDGLYRYATHCPRGNSPSFSVYRNGKRIHNMQYMRGYCCFCQEDCLSMKQPKCVLNSSLCRI